MMWGFIKSAKAEEAVGPMSPARLLAASLTDAETRGEWVREQKRAYGGGLVSYLNSKRDLTVSVWWTACGMSFSNGVTTPFRLNDAEEVVVKEAVLAFERHRREEEEKAALSRLIDPALAAAGGEA